MSPPWYQTAVFYEVLARSFRDADGDGIGDLRGLTDSLDYLQWLGVDCLWLQPVFDSPLRDGGYDVRDFCSIHPEVGTVDDMADLLDAAHRRGLRLISDFVVNHTSDEHPWFQEARTPGSDRRDWYVWSPDATRFAEARIIFTDSQPSNWTWDETAGAYYWHRFYEFQPDLNYDNPEVRAAMLDAIRFWLDLGFDGLRLDAVPYLYQREGTSCENLPETHAFLKEMRRVVDTEYGGDRVLLAEANQWPRDTVPYFGDGDECHMNFHFPVMPRLYMALRREDKAPIIDILEQTPPLPEGGQWAMFLRNHDELTLEMVTDEERDYMYETYAPDPRMRINLGIRRRLAPLMGGDRRSIELMVSLLLSMPGTPVLYYGDEIGMGENIHLPDRHGVRTPMQWSADRNGGFSSANPQKLYLSPITDPEYHYLSVNVEAQTDNPRSLLSWTRRTLEVRRRYAAFGRGSMEHVESANPAVLAYVRAYEGERLLVVANLSRHPQAMALELGVWTGLRPVELFGGARFPAIGAAPYPLTVGGHDFFWFALEAEDAERPVEAALALEVRARWTEVFEPAHRHRLTKVLQRYLAADPFCAGTTTLDRVRVIDVLPLAEDGPGLALVYAEYTDHAVRRYAVPLLLDAEDGAPLATLYRGEERLGVLRDASPSGALDEAVLRAVADGLRVEGERGALCGVAEPKLVTAQTLDLEIFDALSPGVSPVLEVGRHLASRSEGAYGELLGALEYRAGADSPLTIAVLHRACAGPTLATELAERGLDASHAELERVGALTAGLHAALIGEADDAGFAPEPFGGFYQRGQFQGLRNVVVRVWERLGPGPLRARMADVLEALRPLSDGAFTGVRIRTHGALDLSRVLRDGDRLVMRGFGGPRAWSHSERRRKTSALRDVASLLHALQRDAHEGSVEAAAQALSRGYLGAAEGTEFCPSDPAERRTLLNAYGLEVAVYDLEAALDAGDAAKLAVLEEMLAKRLG